MDELNFKQYKDLDILEELTEENILVVNSTGKLYKASASIIPTGGGTIIEMPTQDDFSGDGTGK